MTVIADPSDCGGSQRTRGGSFRTATEREVAGIWQEVLQRPEIGPDDNFLELGGESVLMMMVLFPVRETFGVDLPPGVLLESPKLGDLCSLIDADRAESL